MKRIAFLVLVFATIAIAQEENENRWKKLFESMQNVRTCQDEAAITNEELQTAPEHIDKTQDVLNNEIKMKLRILEKRARFAACILEKTGLMKDSKFNVDKVIETVEKALGKPSINKQILEECLHDLNNNNKLDREERAIGMGMCMLSSRKRKEE